MYVVYSCNDLILLVLCRCLFSTHLNRHTATTVAPTLFVGAFSDALGVSFYFCEDSCLYMTG